MPFFLGLVLPAVCEQRQPAYGRELPQPEQTARSLTAQTHLRDSISGIGT